MNKKLLAIRAVATSLFRKLILIFAGVTGTILLVWLLAIWLLAIEFSAWWWLSLLPWTFALAVAVTLVVLSRMIIKAIFSQPLNNRQKKSINKLIKSIEQALELHTISWRLFLASNAKDVIFHRDFRTTRDIIEDSRQLQKDFKSVEDSF